MRQVCNEYSNAVFLQWVHDRMNNVHGELTGYDYMIRLDQLIKVMAVDEGFEAELAAIKAKQPKFVPGQMAWYPSLDGKAIFRIQVDHARLNEYGWLFYDEHDNFWGESDLYPTREEAQAAIDKENLK